MSLLGTIQQSAGALQAAQIGLQVVGNNIANANTPGYIRENLVQASATASREGGLIKGMGVLPVGINQVIDNALMERMLQASNAVAGSETLETAYGQLEELTNDLNDSGLNNQLTQFNNAVHELSAQPGDAALREFVVRQGETLAGNIRSTRAKAIERQELWNTEINSIASEINRLTDRIAQLNLDIATIEGGGLLHSDATGLRDQRIRDLEELSQFVSLNIQEQESGAIAVFVGGDFLVSNGIKREVYSTYSEAAGGQEIRIRESDATLDSKGGKLAATIQARESVFRGYVEDVDKMAAGLIRAFNEVHSQGQSRKGFDSVTASNAGVAGVPIQDAEFPWTPKNGSFDISVVDTDGSPIETHRIRVGMLGQTDDSTLNSIAADLDAIEGISSSVTRDGRLVIESDSPTAQFAFGEDTSGFLAAAGINTFFTGSDAFDIAVNSVLSADTEMLNVSSGGIGNDTDVLTEMIDLVERRVDHLGKSVRGQYEQTLSSVAQQINLQKSAGDGLRDFYATLQSQHLAITGVNIDEESIKMIAYQRAFQASSRVISTASEMLELLVNL